MFLLTNEQRRCFALSLVQHDWILTVLPPSPYDTYSTYVYITPDNRIEKIIIEGKKQYREYDVSEALSPDRIWILPKIDKGKPVKFTAASITKKTPIGVELSYQKDNITIYSHTTQCAFYRSEYAGYEANSLYDFRCWIDQWCAETGDRELADIEAFARQTRCHVKFKEGDFFRFRLDRHNFGYGRIIIDFAEMRRQKIPFWNAFMGKPVLAGIYHIVTEDPNIRPEQLAKLSMLPPQMIMDNAFFYGECECIGNRPIDAKKIDFPIHYGPSFRCDEDGVMYQCGKTFIHRPDIEPLYPDIGGFRLAGIGWTFRVSAPLLRDCMKKGSNAPYWDQPMRYLIDEDLRNPKNKKALKRIKKQLDL